MSSAPFGDPVLPDAGGAATPGRYDSFVLRVYSRGDTGQMVHGQVTHVSSRQTTRFTDLRAAMAFIAAHVTPASGDTGPPTRD